MTERPVFSASARIYEYSKSNHRWLDWWPDEAASKTKNETAMDCDVWISSCSLSHRSRVIARVKTTEENGKSVYIVNESLYANAQLSRSASHFVQWRCSSDRVFGISFATPEDAQQFAGQFTRATAQLGATLDSTSSLSLPTAVSGNSSGGGDTIRQRRMSFRQASSKLFRTHTREGLDVNNTAGSATQTQTPEAAAGVASQGSILSVNSELVSSASGNNVSLNIEEGDRALVVHVGDSIELKRLQLAGCTARISISPTTSVVDARKIVSEALQSKSSDEEGRIKLEKALAPCHLILRQAGNIEKSLGPNDDLFALAPTLPRIVFDIPGLFTQIPTPKFTCLRDQKAYEVYQSELSYVKTLDKIVNHLMESSKNVLSMADSAQLFCNADQLFVLHTRILNAFRHRLVDQWSETALIADIFLDEQYDFSVYQTYYSNYETIPTLISDFQNRKEVRAWLESDAVTQACSGLGLLNLLIQPCQRLPRYSLLIRELQKETTEDHPDFNNLNRAYEEFNKVARDMNDAVRSTANAKMLNDLLRKKETYVGFVPFLKRKGPEAAKQPYSNLLYYSDVEVQLGVITYSWMLLFDDQLVFASSESVTSRGKTVSTKYKLEMSLPLGFIWIEDMPGSQKDLLRVVHPTNTFLVKVQSVSQKQTWITSGSSAIERYSSKLGYLTTNKGEVVRCFEHEIDGGTWNGHWKSGLPYGQGTLKFNNRNLYEGSAEEGKLSGEGTMQYSDGSVYAGGWAKNKPHGEGTLTKAEGTYVGMWDNGFREGSGKLEWPNGDTYTGEWSKDLMSGNGRLELKSEKVTYSGEFQGGRFHGRGTLTTEQDEYDGEWQNDLRYGKGCFKSKKGVMYDGEWVEDRRHGKGRLVAGENGRVSYEGDFVDDQFHGSGTLIVTDSFEYTGEFKEGRQHGRGVMKWADGASYDGGWADDRRSAQGKMIEYDGSVYEGHWHNDKRFGRGTLVCADGTRYDGEWVKGRKEGKGVLTLPNGAKYSGNWTEDRRHGRGVFVCGNTKYVGSWENDMRHGKGTLSTPQGDYDGMWVKDVPEGIGTFKSKAITYEGKWKGGRRHGRGKITLAHNNQVVEVEYVHGKLRYDPTQVSPTFPLIPDIFRM